MLLQVPEARASAHPLPAARNFAAFLLFDSDDGLEETRIIKALADRADKLGAPFDVSATTERRLKERRVTGTFHRRFERVALDVLFAQVKLSIAISGGPGDRAYWQRFVDPERWPDAFETIGRERTFVSILERGDADGSQGLDAAYDRALATTLTADVISGLDEVLAVLWHPARQALSPERFYQAIRPLQKSRSPLELWACLRLLPANAGGPAGVATEGLLPLIGREIEVPPSTLGTERVARIAIELATALIDGAASVEDGGSWTDSNDMRVTVSAAAGRSGLPVWQLSPMTVTHA